MSSRESKTAASGCLGEPRPLDDLLQGLPAGGAPDVSVCPQAAALALGPSELSGALCGL